MRRGSQHLRTTCRTLEHVDFDVIPSFRFRRRPNPRQSPVPRPWRPTSDPLQLLVACVFLHWWLGRWFVIVCSFSFEICATEWRGHAVCAWKWMPADFVCSTCLMLFITSHVLWSNAVACISFSWLLTCWSDCALITAPFLTERVDNNWIPWDRGQHRHTQLWQVKAMVKTSFHHSHYEAQAVVLETSSIKKL